jgi:hypothetical protein
MGNRPGVRYWMRLDVEAQAGQVRSMLGAWFSVA